MICAPYTGHIPSVRRHPLSPIPPNTHISIVVVLGSFRVGVEEDLRVLLLRLPPSTAFASSCLALGGNEQNEHQGRNQFGSHLLSMMVERMR